MKSYNDCLQAQMILSIEDNNVEYHQDQQLEQIDGTLYNEQTYLFDESDV